MRGWIIAFAAVVMALLALALVGYLTGNWDEDMRPGYSLMSAKSQPVEPCMDEETRERIRGIFIEAIDDGLKDHIKHVFQIWMKDDRDQPARATVGVRQGVRAYIGSRTSALKWDPPRCPN